MTDSVRNMDFKDRAMKIAEEFSWDLQKPDREKLSKLIEDALIEAWNNGHDNGYTEAQDSTHE